MSTIGPEYTRTTVITALILAALNSLIFVNPEKISPIVMFAGLPVAVVGLFLATRKTSDPNIDMIRWKISVRSGLIGLATYCVAAYFASQQDASGLLGVVLIVSGVFLVLPINLGVGFLLARLLVPQPR